ncbi:right-handed parallel beta-helix repeat-containing protein [Mycolicibacterium vaccae]|uniref:right-handed parallel beta-helix repeat-containing protein n=1 Tax=Mycolicibacterium vaccae TaxID=1810 RepID=UPI003CEDDDCD
MAAVAACTRPSRRAVVNVRDHGAAGDGVADDSAGIRAAVETLKPGDTLRFPTGSYRVAELNPQSGAAVRLDGLSDVTVEFDSGAELVMDNIDPITRKGTAHGILIHGPATGITLRNIKIRWLAPATRSMGDGIRILGCVADSDQTPRGWEGTPAPVSKVDLIDCEIRASAQSGVIIIGASDVRITGLRVYDTAADGLHFNACRRVTVDDYVAADNGDDGLAFVTYFNDEPFFDSAAETFAFPELTDWSNADLDVTNVHITGGIANGVRLAGAQRVSITGLEVVGKREGSGVITDSATVESDPIWHYLASRDVRLDDITVRDCSIGIQMLARPPKDRIDARFTDFDVQIDNATVSACTNWGVRVESLTDQRVTGLRLGRCRIESTSTDGGDGGVGLSNTKDVAAANLTLSHAKPVTMLYTSESSDLQIDALRLGIADTGQPFERPPAPCAIFEDSTGTITSMAVTWPSAPPSWTPVVIRTADAVCDAATPESGLAIQRLTVEPGSVENPVGDC